MRKRNMKKSNCLQVETPLGTIIVRAAVDPEHPGVYIDLHRPGVECDMPLALVEFSADECDLPEREQFLITRIWGNAMQEDYTNRVIHERIEDFFREDMA